MTETTLRDQLDGLVLDEPAMTLGLPSVIEEGRQLRRRHRLFAGGIGVGAAVAVAAAVAVPLSLTGSVDQDRLVPTNGVPVAAGGGSDQSLTPAQQRIADAIRSASPSGWTFDLGPDRWDGAVDVEGTADDGNGAGQLSVGLSVVPGAQQVHPCADPEFAAGVGCQERTLADGSVLSVRDVLDDNGIKYTQVALTHPDGTGVIASSGNDLISWPLPSVATAEQKRQLAKVNRPMPTYTPQQLAAVAIAVDSVTR
jgi:hypothetical protein